MWQLVGLAVTAAGVALCVQGGAAGWCSGLTVATLGVLTFANQFASVTRVRVTSSKLLVEDERLVMGFLIGPSKRRIPWQEFEDVTVAGGKLTAKGKSAVLEVGSGCTEAELNELSRMIRDKVQAYRDELATTGG